MCRSHVLQAEALSCYSCHYLELNLRHGALCVARTICAWTLCASAIPFIGLTLLPAADALGGLTRIHAHANLPWLRYEMTYELVLHSASYAKAEWRNAHPWNKPTSRKLAGGEVASYGFRMILASSLEDVESSLIRAGIPVAQPLPSPVLPVDMTSATLVCFSAFAAISTHANSFPHLGAVGQRCMLRVLHFRHLRFHLHWLRLI